ncbi:MAG: hypothetical protein IJ940_09020 [Bacteroidales bacterium]|nr:hypothetical protein [Bacteroidales bacterium]
MDTYTHAYLAEVDPPDWDFYDYIIVDISDTKYDTAKSIWKNGARMPNLNDADELVNNCTWSKHTLNNVSGYLVIGPNKNSIFIPLSGYKSESNTIGINNDSYLWIGSLDPEYSYFPAYIHNNNTTYWQEPSYIDCDDGLPVRPVKDREN